LKTEIDERTGDLVPVIDEPSADDIATARNNYIQAQQTIQEGKKYLEVLKTGQIPDDATGEKITALYEAQLAVEDAKSALDAMQLVAPISGTVTSLDLNVGEQAGTDSVVTISQLSQPYTLDAYIDAEDWDMARAGNKVNVTFDLLPEKTYTGTVTLVYPELSESFESSLVRLVVQLDQSISQDLPAGTSGTVNVIGGEARNAVLVPLAAIHRGNDGKAYVTLLQNGQQVEREIELGLQNGAYAEVKSGLDAGETVVTR
jgi:RND family efflux transporter MFP subunit